MFILQSPPEPPQISVDDLQEVKDKAAPSGSDYVLTATGLEQALPTACCFTGNYVFLPNPGVPPASTEEPVTHGNHHNDDDDDDDRNPPTEVEDSEMGGQYAEEEDQSRTALQTGPMSNASVYI